jgi:FkbM family methyltransferase
MIKKYFKHWLEMRGYEIRNPSAFPAGCAARPTGRMNYFLEDLHARGFRPANVLDVGAHNAGWSRTASSIFQDGKFFLIEPKVEMEPYLQKFVNENPGAAYFLVGAGAKNEVKTLSLWPNAGEGSSFLPREQGSLQEKGVQRKVEIVTIDSLISDGRMPSPQFLKVDVEGFELEVLTGASMALNSSEVVILEASLYQRLPGMPLIHEIISFMTNRGFLVYDFPGFHKRPEVGVLFIVDICFVKESSPLRPLIKGLYTD